MATATTSPKKNSLTAWINIYNLFHSGKKTEAWELALSEMDYIIRRFILSGYKNGARDMEEFYNIAALIIRDKLETYEPYQKVMDDNGNETIVSVTGMTYMHDWLLEAYSNFTLGGDGFGHGGITKYQNKKKGGIVFESIDDDRETAVCSSISFQTRFAAPSAEEVFFDKLVDADILMFKEMTKNDSPDERRKKWHVYKKLSELDIVL